MAQVRVQINNRGYQVACGDGEQERITRLAGYVDGKVQALVRDIGNVGDQRLVVMASLLLADEVFEKRGDGGPASRAGPGDAAAMERLSERIEQLAARLDESAGSS